MFNFLNDLTQKRSCQLSFGDLIIVLIIIGLFSSPTRATSSTTIKIINSMPEDQRAVFLHVCATAYKRADIQPICSAVRHKQRTYRLSVIFDQLAGVLPKRRRTSLPPSHRKLQSVRSILRFVARQQLSMGNRDGNDLIESPVTAVNPQKFDIIVFTCPKFHYLCALLNSELFRGADTVG